MFVCFYKLAIHSVEVVRCTLLSYTVHLLRMPRPASRVDQVDSSRLGFSKSGQVGL